MNKAGSVKICTEGSDRSMKLALIFFPFSSGIESYSRYIYPVWASVVHMSTIDDRQKTTSLTGREMGLDARWRSQE